MAHTNYTYTGIIVPVFAIFSDNSFNLDIIPKYARYLAEQKINGVLVNDIIGEGMSMEKMERKVFAETWAKAAREFKLHLMVQIGGASLPQVIDLAKHAENIHADFILCLPDLFKPATSEELIDYLKIISNAAPRTPLLYYHIPTFTNVNIHMGDFLESVGDKIPTFVGIKFTSANLEECAQAIRVNSKKYIVFFDNDQLINAACALGIDSFVSATTNIFPKLVLDIFAANKNGDAQTARDKQEQLSRVVVSITKHVTLYINKEIRIPIRDIKGKHSHDLNLIMKLLAAIYRNCVQTMKLAMCRFTNIQTGIPRLPLRPLSFEVEKTMIKDLMKLGYKVSNFLSILYQ